MTVEIPTEQGSVCYAAELRLAGPEHDGGLDEGHPVIYVHCMTDDEQVRTVPTPEQIGLLDGQ